MCAARTDGERVYVTSCTRPRTRIKHLKVSLLFAQRGTLKIHSFLFILLHNYLHKMKINALGPPSRNGNPVLGGPDSVQLPNVNEAAGTNQRYTGRTIADPREAMQDPLPTSRRQSMAKLCPSCPRVDMEGGFTWPPML